MQLGSGAWRALSMLFAGEVLAMTPDGTLIVCQWRERSVAHLFTQSEGALRWAVRCC